MEIDPPGDYHLADLGGVRDDVVCSFPSPGDIECLVEAQLEANEVRVLRLASGEDLLADDRQGSRRGRWATGGRIGRSHQ